MTTSTTKKQEAAIAFESSIPHPEKEGYLKFAGVKSSEEIQHQIREALKSIKIEDYNALEAAEWISMEGKYDEKFEVPMHGSPIVFWRHGNNEGEIVEIHLRDHSRKFYPICSIKFLLGSEFAQVVTSALIEACQAGLYGER